MEKIVEFDWMCKDEVYAHIVVNRETGEVTCEEYRECLEEQFFAMRPKTIEWLQRRMEDRTIDSNRPDIQEFLDYWGLKEYSPYEFCRKTHGVSTNDFFWIRWKGEDLKWNDVRVR